ncbi:MAG: HEAT repeat domain-containing protein [Planctomycetes bacterium]|nr:HEAT repeat domain-containing protein [Planctomycetota bacterium]
MRHKLLVLMGLLCLCIIIPPADAKPVSLSINPCLKVGIPVGTPMDWVHTKTPKQVTTGHPSYVITVITEAPKAAAPVSPTAQASVSPTETAPVSPTGKTAVSPELMRGKTELTRPVKLDMLTRSVQIVKTFTVPFDPFAMENTASRDMSQHIPWVDQAESFSPKLDPNTRQMLKIAIVRIILYPDFNPESQLAHYFIELGQVGLYAAQVGMVAGTLWGGYVNYRTDQSWPAGHANQLGAYVKSAIGPAAPQPPPAAEPGATPFETMVRRLIVEELGKDYYHGTNPNFARCLRALGDAAAPDVIEASLKSKHSLIKRNAVSMLRNYNSPEALNALLENMKGKDAVCRNRALTILVKSELVQNNKEAMTAVLNFLVDLLKGITKSEEGDKAESPRDGVPPEGGNKEKNKGADKDKEKPKAKDKFLPAYAAYNLGCLGDPRAVEPLIEYYRSDPNDKDMLWAVPVALGRIAHKDDDVVKALKEIVAKKRPISATMAKLALAALGDKEAFEGLHIKSPKPLSKLEVQTYYFAAEVLAHLADPVINPKDYKTYETMLFDIIKDVNSDIQLRLYVFQYLNINKSMLADLKNIITDKKVPPILQAYALYKLVVFDEQAAIKSAEGLVQEFLDNPKDVEKQVGGGFDTVTAMRVLGAFEKSKDSTLKKVIDKIIASPKKDEAYDPNNPTVATAAPLADTAILELGCIHTKEAEEYLVKKLRDVAFPYRDRIALALAKSVGSKDVLNSLAKILEAPDNELNRIGAGWLRFVAYTTLLKLKPPPKEQEADYTCDWIFDEPKVREKSVKQWQQWITQ